MITYFLFNFLFEKRRAFRLFSLSSIINIQTVNKKAIADS